MHNSIIERLVALANAFETRCPGQPHPQRIFTEVHFAQPMGLIISGVKRVEFANGLVGKIFQPKYPYLGTVLVNAGWIFAMDNQYSDSTFYSGTTRGLEDGDRIRIDTSVLMNDILALARARGHTCPRWELRGTDQTQQYELLREDANSFLSIDAMLMAARKEAVR